MQQKKVNFINEHGNWIIQEAVKYKDDLGYLVVFVNDDYTINQNMTGLMPGEFDKKEFVEMPVKDNISEEEGEQLNKDVVEAANIYFCLMWLGDETKHCFKKLILLHKTEDYDKFKSP